MQSELLKLAINLTYMLETPLERNQVCLGFVLDKLHEMDRACKKPGFGSPQGGVKYKPMAPVLPSPKVAYRPSVSNVLGKGKKVSLNAIIRGKGPIKNNDRSSHLSSAYEEEFNSNTQ